MAAATPGEEPGQNFRIQFPEKATCSNHLTGRYPLIGPRRAEVRQNLASYGISPQVFEEYVENTRYNRQYVRYISDKLGMWDT